MTRHRSRAARATASAARGLRREIRKLERERLSSGEIDERITGAIIESVIARGTVQLTDLLRTNIPKDAVTKERFMRCLDAAREREPAVATVEAFA